jgi:general secretion pathway protein G
MISQKKEAFTLMEVMLAVVIIGVLSTLVVPGIIKKMRNMKINTTMHTMAALKSALMDYNQDVGHFPSAEEGNLKALLKRPRGIKKWDGPYIENTVDVPTDEWNNDFEYNKTPKKYKNIYKFYEIISDGPEDAEEDIHTGQ